MCIEAFLFHESLHALEKTGPGWSGAGSDCIVASTDARSIPIGHLPGPQPILGVLTHRRHILQLRLQVSIETTFCCTNIQSCRKLGAVGYRKLSGAQDLPPIQRSREFHLSGSGSSRVSGSDKVFRRRLHDIFT